MNVEQGLEVTNTLVLAKTRRRLSPVEVAILSGSWQGQTYEEIVSSAANSSHTWAVAASTFAWLSLATKADWCRRFNQRRWLS